MIIVPVRWPMYLCLFIIAGYGLFWEISAHRLGKKLTDGAVVFRYPLALTFIYGLSSMVRTIWFWAASGYIFYDPPTHIVLAAFCNAVLLTWVAECALLLYLRRH